MIWRFFYTTFFLPPLWLFFQAFGLINSKVRKGWQGRSRVFSDLEEFNRTHPGGSRLWVHASSMGEFEQAKPIINALKAAHPDINVLCTFFSPSGYENNRSYIGADGIFYLPFDWPGNAERFLNLAKPQAALFIRYDVWPNFIHACDRASVPVILASATLRKDSLRLLPIAKAFHRKLYSHFDAILTVSNNDAETFKQFGLEGVRIEAIGDTRFDRVSVRAKNASRSPLLPEAFTSDSVVVTVGSSWREDEDRYLPGLISLLESNNRLKAVIVPHEPEEDHLKELEQSLPESLNAARFSKYSGSELTRCILVDSIGKLLALYASADIAFVGGGFKSNVHNTLEPAAYGIPVVYGPKIHNSQEARALAESGGGYIVDSAEACSEVLTRLTADEGARLESGKAAGEFVSSRTGATGSVLDTIAPMLGR